MKNVRGLMKDVFVGKARNLSDEHLFHKVSLIALFAWVGLGADGLSSSCYGPEEAFKALGSHYVLSPFIALACIVTIAILCASYSQIIELFPGGGGGYLVASKLLSPSVGAVSGCALLIDYILTIALSVSSGSDALFSILPSNYMHLKLPFAVAITLVLTTLNLRGVRESVLLWVPIFFIFLGTHLFAILFAIATHLGNLPAIVTQTAAETQNVHSQIGTWGLFLLLIRAYSVGAGTYTGIEAVSNGLPILREPKVATGKRTMLYMGLSLGITVGGLFLAYLLYRVEPQAGKTLNASLFEQLTRNWPSGLGQYFIWTAMSSAMALLFIAAQAGFLDGPRIMSNMAIDRWLPARFAALSDRLVTQNGILLMGISAVIVIVLAHGSVGMMVVLYSINVFITFSLSQLGMIRHWWLSRRTEPRWKHGLAVNGIGFCLTFFILVMLSIVKFWEGGWITLLATGIVAAIAFAIHRHYHGVMIKLKRLENLAAQFQKNAQRQHAVQVAKCDPAAKTAVIFVSGFNGLGVHTLLSVMQTFEGVFRNFVFIQTGIVDAGNFKGTGEIDGLKIHISEQVNCYVQCMSQLGYHAEAVTDIGTDVVEMADQLASQTISRFPQSVFFGGQIVFEDETWITRLLHNYVTFAIQRKLFRRGMKFLILPIRA